MISSTSTPVKGRSILFPWLMCGIAILFYAYNYFLRVSTSTMMNEVTEAFHITATKFSFLVSLYYFAYTPMQIPAGMLLDRFGVRFILFAASTMAIAGLTVFAFGDTFGVAATGRFMIGLGTAFAYISSLKMASVWLPPNRFALAACLTTTIGMTAAALTETFLGKFVDEMGYHRPLYFGIFIGVVVACCILLFLRSTPKNQQKTTKKEKPLSLQELFQALGKMLANPQMWIIGLIGCFFYLPSSVFMDLYGIPYLTSVYGMTKGDAGQLVSTMFLGWIVASPIIGAVSDKLKRRSTLLVVASIAATLLTLVIFYTPGFSISTLYILFFLTGAVCGAHPLCFALGKENNPLRVSGIAVALTNTLIMAGGFVFQPVVGRLLDYHATLQGTALKIVNGHPVYSLSDYNYALSIIPIALGISILLSFFLKETYSSRVEVSSTEKTTPLRYALRLHHPEMQPKIETVN